MPSTPELFRAALGRFASGVTVVTSLDAAGRPNGLTVTAFSSVSLAPPLVMVGIDLANDSGPAIRHTGRFNVHLLKSGHEGWSRRFSERPNGADPFIGLDLGRDAHGLPCLPDPLAFLACRVVHDIPAGDHVLFIGQVEEINVSDGDPLLYFRGGYRALDMEPSQ
ncbi:MAG TPA: flavin reductase family protein [Candidatus Eisenbacteria bacterium]